MASGPTGAGGNHRVVIVTGAAGFLGRYVARLLAEQGFRVVGIGHGTWAPEEQRSWGVHVWRDMDVTVHAIDSLQVEPEMLFHCAGGGSVPFANDHPLADFQRTVASTAHVLEYLRTRAPRCRLVYPSSAGVYGAVRKVPIAEHAPHSPLSKYAEHKSMAENNIRFSARHYGLRASAVRLFSAYGPGLRKQLLWDACRKLTAGDNSFGGTGQELRDWLHVEDAAALLLEAAHRATSDCPVVNGGSGEGVTVRNILEHVAQHLLGSARGIHFSGEARLGDPHRLVADVTVARCWGWAPQHDWRTGIASYVAWWKTEGRA